METENNFEMNSQMENKKDNSKVYLLVIIILSVLLIGSWVFIYLLVTGSDVVKTIAIEEKTEEVEETSDRDGSNNESNDSQNQDNINAETDSSDNINAENENSNADSQEIAGVSIVKYVDKYKETLDIMRQEDADLFIDYSVNSLDTLLDRGFITQQYYDDSTAEILSFSKEEVTSMLEMANDFGMTDRDDTLPSDKFMDINETYEITEDESVVMIEVIYEDPVDSLKTSIEAEFFVDAENDEVFYTLQ